MAAMQRQNPRKVVQGFSDGHAPLPVRFFPHGDDFLILVDGQLEELQFRAEARVALQIGDGVGVARDVAGLVDACSFAVFEQGYASFSHAGKGLRDGIERARDVDVVIAQEGSVDSHRLFEPAGGVDVLLTQKQSRSDERETDGNVGVEEHAGIVGVFDTVDFVEYEIESVHEELVGFGKIVDFKAGKFIGPASGADGVVGGPQHHHVACGGRAG
mmetsp:Transcript_37127/g.86579  ORF Transcript_37127/g.86579 Transcript_37127/m.86579 type:complete len:215 (+) Transcript_37127:820-1464(+)